MKAAILVTGAGGMIGRRLVASLAAHGHTVIAASRRPVRIARTVLNPTGDLFSASYRSKALGLLARARADERVVVHMAALNLFGDSPQEYAQAVRSNVGLTESMLEAAAQIDCKRFVFTSTGLVYGTKSARPRTETSTTVPVRSFYACTKLAAEQLVQGWASTSSMQGEIVRLSNVFGPDSPEASVTGRILSHIRRNRPVQIDYGFPIRDFVFVDDVVEALSRLIENPSRKATAVTTVGTGVGTSIADLVATAAGVAGVSSVAPRISAQGEKNCLILSTDYLHSRLGWAPTAELARQFRDCIPKSRLDR